MPPKGKKVKKQEDDTKWSSLETKIPGLEALQDEFPETKPKASGFSAIASNANGEDDPFAGEDMGGGLMGAIQANLGKKGKKKEKKARAPSPSYDEVDDIAPPSAVVEKTAEELAEEEWALPTQNKKKKSSAKKAEPVAEVEEASTPVEVDDEDDDEPSGRVLSKKEKEKLKKEREKAKKKAQADAKKAEAAALDNILGVSAPAATPAPVAKPTPTPAPAPAPTPADTAPAEDDDDEEGEGDGTAAKSDKKKKKKKKPAAKEEVKKEPPKKKPAAGVAALRALMEQQKAAEEEARKKAEEERLRIEEEERIAEEEERLKEEAKLKRKEKEKAKRAVAKQEGRLLTDKQKREKQQAEIARKALIASGVRIEGLEKAAEPSAAAAPKKVVYGNRKRPVNRASEASPSPHPSPLPAVSPALPAIETPSTPAPSDEIPSSISATVGDDVKDDWDASSDEDETPAPPPPPAKAAVATANGKSAPAPTSKDAPKTASKVPAAAVKEEEDEEEESEEEEDSTDEASGSDDSDSDSDDSDDDSDDSEELTAVQKQAAIRKAEATQRRVQRHEEALAARSKDDLRSPICCILGHVDTGKTKLLDKIRQTNVQEGEAGGITQQIGATYFPVSAIKEKTLVLNKDGTKEYNIPGLLVIDTPGHESFTNLRSRGSSLCNIAVLVVDIMHGLEPQTLESLRLLRDKKTPFVVALNKIDRIYGWDPTPNGAFQESLAKQSPSVQREFAHRLQETIVAFAEQGLNSLPYYDNKNMSKNVSLVPTSAITGEGVPDMIMLLVHLTQTRLSDNLMYLSELEATVLEVKIIEGLGTTIDVVLSNGVLREGDRIVLCGLNGPIVTNVRALLTPQPLRELRIKSQYVHHKEVKAALGVKITAPDLDKAIAGSRLMVVGPDDDEDELRDEVMSDLTNLMSSVEKSGRGVSVQASTLGSLEALLEFLKVSKIPVASIGIGPVHKRDIMQASMMVEKAKELACVLCFDVTVDKDAEKIAEEYGIKIFKADIIYHLFDAFTAYNAEMVEAKRRDAAPIAIWPCRLKIIAVFTKRDPIIVGVDILDGTLHTGTPLCVVKTDPTTGKRDVIRLGKITSLEINHKTMDVVKKSQAGGGVAVKIEHAVYESAKMFGRHFDDKDELYSQITRQSIDVMKESFRKDVSMEEWALIKKLKEKLDIQ